MLNKFTDFLCFFRHYEIIILKILDKKTIGITNGNESLFMKKIDKTDFLNFIKSENPIHVKYSFRLSENEDSCLRNDKYDMYPVAKSR